MNRFGMEYGDEEQYTGRSEMCVFVFALNAASVREF